MSDKRARFAPSTQSMVAVCPVQWLLSKIGGDGPQRWEMTGVLAHPPYRPLILPVRDLRLIFGLHDRHFRSVVQHSLPQAHEFFIPMQLLMVPHAYRQPQLASLLARTSSRGNFYEQAA